MAVSKESHRALSFIEEFYREFSISGSSSFMTVPASEDRGAAADKASLDRRRAAAKRVREARDRLTSTSGTRPAIDYELLRQFAQNRLSAAIAILLLIATVGFLSGLWTGPLAAGIWTVGVLAIHAAILAQCRRLLSQAPADVRITTWRARFVLLDLCFGVAWALNVTTIVEQDAGSGTFMLFVMLLVVAVSSMLASSLPVAMFAATVPVTAAVAFELVLRGDVHDYILAAMAVTAQGYFTMLAHRLYSTTLATLEARAEKDALIGELEQAKAKSDEARRHAEAANIAKSRFLAQMSHELRTPLNAILGFSEVMKSEVFGPHAVPPYRECAADIHNSGVHLLNLINEILDLSRIEAGHYELNEEAIALTHIVEDCQHLLNLRAKKRGITIHQAFEPNLPRLWADERAVRQICLNLLSNAIKFTPQGGEGWLKAGWTAASGQYLSVRDTGPGIPENEIPIVLDTFGQGSNAIKSAEQGAGLGLPIVKSLIELHGGTFSLKSKLREGTEVIVTFPPERVMAALEPMVEPNVTTILSPPPTVPEPADQPGAFSGFLASISFGRVRRRRAAKAEM